MTASFPTVARPRSRAGITALVFVAVGISAFVAANVHLVYVSVMSQRDCVPHAKETGASARNVYKAARSSC